MRLMSRDVSFANATNTARPPTPVGSLQTLIRVNDRRVQSIDATDVGRDIDLLFGIGLEGVSCVT